METEFAPAKINLTLHVTGQRADGYHLLDSLVVFADLGDRVMARLDGPPGLTITGPMAAGLEAGPDNLVLRAAGLMGVDAQLVLEKVLPVSSGIGGGSADAAATLRLLSRLGGRPLPDHEAIARMGADVPVCLAGRATRMSGVGDVLCPVASLPEAWLLLVNPRLALSTPQVFRALARKDNAPMPRDLPRLKTAHDLAAFIQMQRNDLQAPAQSLAPVIAGVRAAIGAQPGCLAARMSGSGATCFGLFADGLSAAAAARTLQTAQPGWWVAAARMLA